MSPQKSVVWKHYLNEGKVARCIRCGALVNRSGNTTNLWSHLQSKHNIDKTSIHANKDSASLPTPGTSASAARDGEDIQAESEDDPDSSAPIVGVRTSTNTTSSRSKENKPQNPPKAAINTKSVRITEAFTRQSSFKKGGETDRAITEALVYMIVKDSLPFCTPEKEGFKHFLKVCVPLWRGISRRTVTRLVEAKYNLVSQGLKEEFPKVNYICLTCDIWIEVQTRKSYLGITAHYLNEKGEMTTVMLDVIPLEERHTAVHLAEAMDNVLANWKIKKDQITAVVTDNGANIKLAVEILLGPNKHVSCIAHSLNLVPAEAMKQVPELVLIKEKVKAIVTFFKKSIPAADALRLSPKKPEENSSLERTGCDDEQDDNEPLKLKQEVPTRFYSTLIMFDRFYALREHVASALTKVIGPDMLTGTELAIVKDVIDYLEPFKNAITELSGEKYVTCSKVIPLIHCLKKTMQDAKAISEPVQKLKTNLLTSLEKRFCKIEESQLHALSSLVDPRFKRIHFTDANAHASVIAKASVLVQQSQSKHCEQAKETDRESGEVLRAKPDSLWSFHNSLVATVAAVQPDMEDVPVELQQFLSQLPYDLSSDPLKIWKNLKESFPNVYVVASKCLPIPASSVPCERLFSKTGRLVEGDRNRLSPKMLGKLCFLNSIPYEKWSL